MMNINNDSEMLAYGRYCAKQKLIRKAQESIRDIAVIITSSNDAEAVENLAQGLDKHVKELIEALKIETKVKE